MFELVEAQHYFCVLLQGFCFFTPDLTLILHHPKHLEFFANNTTPF